MKSLLDMGITPRAIELIARHGHEAIRCGDVGLGRASDEELVEYARARDAVVIATDKRFGEIIMLSGVRSPGAILLRLGNATFDQMLSAIERVLETYAPAEIQSAITTVEPDKMRRHSLCGPGDR